MVKKGGRKQKGPENDPHHVVLTHHRNRNQPKQLSKQNARQAERKVKVAAKQELKQARALAIEHQTKTDRLLSAGQTVFLLRAPQTAEALSEQSHSKPQRRGVSVL